jgi:hypothetical protein
MLQINLNEVKVQQKPQQTYIIRSSGESLHFCIPRSSRTDFYQLLSNAAKFSPENGQNQD